MLNWGEECHQAKALSHRMKVLCCHLVYVYRSNYKTLDEGAVLCQVKAEFKRNNTDKITQIRMHTTLASNLISRVSVCVCACVRVLPVEGWEEAAGGQHEGPAGEDSATVVDPLQVAPRHVRHANGASRAVQEFIAVPAEGGGRRQRQYGWEYRALVWLAIL